MNDNSQMRPGKDYDSQGGAKPGFNSTQPRFNYFKDQKKQAEVPGPGSYAAQPRLHTLPN